MYLLYMYHGMQLSQESQDLVCALMPVEWHAAKPRNTTRCIMKCSELPYQEMTTYIVVNYTSFR